MIDDIVNANSKAFTLMINFLQKWNKKINLTSISDTKEIFTKHIHDSLSISKYIDKSEVLDLGTGAGFPGIPLAIAHPDKRFTLLDSNKKNINYLEHLIIELGLSNISLVHSRIEDLSKKYKFKIVVCRAFGTLENIYKNSCENVDSDGKMILMKGKKPIAELAQLPKSLNIMVDKLEIGGLNAERHVIIIKGFG